MSLLISSENVRLALLRQILNPRSGEHRPEVVVGTGEADDAAILQVSAGEYLVVSSDFVRGSGFYLFELGYLDYFDVGYYLIAANASDLAAMGAKPIAATTIVRYTDKMTDDDFVSVFRGIKAAADEFGLEIVGGDIGGHSADVFAATAIGSVRPDRVLMRNGAHIGDVLCVTGPVGRPITALTYFKKAKPAGLTLALDVEEQLLNSWRRPIARVREGQIISDLNCATACQDISDGLKATIDQISEASNVSIRVYEDKIPIIEATNVVAQYLGTDPTALAMSASVDFELLFSLPVGRVTETMVALSHVGCHATVIGEVIQQGDNLLVDRAGTERILPGVAWQQQTGDYLADIIRRGGKA